MAASPASKSPSPPPSPPPPQGSLWLVLPTWLVPGLGFFVKGHWGRGAIQFLMVVATFAIGLDLHGGVTWPSWSPSDQAFNLINNITVIIQLGAGLPALASLWAAQHGVAWLGGTPENPYYELGSYYLIVAGAVNYFAVCNLSDRFLRPAPRFVQGLEPPPKTDGTQPSAKADHRT